MRGTSCEVTEMMACSMSVCVCVPTVTNVNNEMNPQNVLNSSKVHFYVVNTSNHAAKEPLFGEGSTPNRWQING